MKAVIQRVSRASVTVDGSLVSSIGRGLMILFCVEPADEEKQLEWLAKKCAKMRIFPDENGVMNISVNDIGGDVMVVSQFTLAANIEKGNRPSYIGAAEPGKGEAFYNLFCEMMESEIGKPVARGIFGADMKVELINDGPVTIIVDR